MRFYMVPFAVTDSDDWTRGAALVVRATHERDAVARVREAVIDLDPAVWGGAANGTTDSRAENAGDDGYYVSHDCACGDDGCETGAHETSTALVQLHGSETTAFDSESEALESADAYSREGRSGPGAETVFATVDDDDADDSAGDGWKPEFEHV